MSGPGLTLTIREAPGNFFDRRGVLMAMDRAKRAVLSKAGAFVRQRAATLIVRHKMRSFGQKTRFKNMSGISPVGEPPYSHTGLIQRLMYFAWDAAAETVVIGPAKLNKPGNALELLEFGGTGSFMMMRFAGRGSPRVPVVKRGTWRPRPFMSVALRDEAPKFPALWENSLRK